MGILTNAGVLKNGKISQNIVNTFFNDVKKLLGEGNDPSNFWIVPLPPKFGPDPVNAKMTSLGIPLPPYEDRSLFPMYHKIFIDTMLEGTAKTLDVNGSTPFAPVADPCAIAVKLGLPQPDLPFDKALKIFPPSVDTLIEAMGVDLTDVDLIAELVVKIPELALPAKPPNFPPKIIGLGDLSFNLTNPDIKLPTPKIDDLPLPPFPPPLPNLAKELNIKIPGKDFNIPSIIPLLKCILIVGIPKIFVKLITEGQQLIAKLPKGPLGIVEFVAEVVITVLAACLGPLALGTLLTFVAGLVVYVKFLVTFLVVVVIGQLLGDGCLTSGFSKFLLSSPS